MNRNIGIKNYLGAGIYAIECDVLKRVYVGMSRNVEHRLTTHRQALVKGNHKNARMQRDWNNGNDFEFKLLRETRVRELGLEESFFMDTYAAAGWDLYNIQRTTRDVPVAVPRELRATIKKVIEALKIKAISEKSLNKFVDRQLELSTNPVLF